MGTQQKGAMGPNATTGDVYGMTGQDILNGGGNMSFYQPPSMLPQTQSLGSMAMPLYQPQQQYSVDVTKTLQALAQQMLTQQHGNSALYSPFTGNWAMANAGLNPMLRYSGGTDADIWQAAMAPMLQAKQNRLAQRQAGLFGV